MPITLSTEQVTPDQAAKWLTVNTGNRKITEGLIARIASDIQNGRWHETGDTIKLTEGETRLLDGQNRCHAVVKAGMPIQTGVARGVDPASFVVQDTGKKRTAGDILHAAGYTDTNILSSAVRKAMMFTAGLSSRHGARNAISVSELLDYLEANKDAFATSMRIKSRMVGIMPYSLCVAMRFAFGLIDEERAIDFFDGLSTGTGLEEGNPIYALRERLRKIMSDRGMRKHGDEALIAHITIKAWNHFLDGNSCLMLSVRQTESFPSLLDRIPEKFHRVA